VRASSDANAAAGMGGAALRALLPHDLATRMTVASASARMQMMLLWHGSHHHRARRVVAGMAGPLQEQAAIMQPCWESPVAAAALLPPVGKSSLCPRILHAAALYARAAAPAVG
jgi:hypothetical protein